MKNYRVIPTVAAAVLASLLLMSGVAAAGGGAGTLSGTAPAGTVVYIETIPGMSFDPPADRVRMDQQGMEFVPFVMPVQVGTTVEFHNSDAVVHNVFTPDECAGSFNLGNWGKGEARDFTFEQSCAAVILCSLHPEMYAFVVAVPTPFYTVTDDSGHFSIEGVPDGTFDVTVWSAEDDPVTTSVTVAGDTTVDLS